MTQRQQQQQPNELEQLIEPLMLAEYDHLRAAHPAFAAYLDMTILVRPIFGGAWDVIGQLYGSQAEADEACKAAIMFELTRIDGVGR